MIQLYLQNVQEALYRMILSQEEHLRSLSDEQLRDLQHLCEERKTHEDWTARSSAEINNACAEMILLERKDNELKRRSNQTRP